MERKPDPLKHEDRYFAEQEKAALEKLRKAREEKMRAQDAAVEGRRLEEIKAAHWMKCPKCGHDMAEKDMGKIQVDVCSRCEGVFFDRGELDQFALFRQEERRNLFLRILGI